MKVFVVLAAFLLMSGCSVKEDRTDCPCRLVLDFRNIDTSVVSSLNLLAVMDGEPVFQDVVGSDAFDSEYIRYVPHGDVRINIWAGAQESIVVRQGVVIPYGCECPPIFMHSFVADTRGESWHENVCMHKNHCRLTVQMDGVSEIPYSLTLKGNVDGYGLDGGPSTGDFSCVAYPGAEGESHVLLPRQMDASLLLEVDDGTSALKTFAIGEYIVSSGYDWNAQDLADIAVTLDYYITDIRISVQGWDKEYTYNITL